MHKIQWHEYTMLLGLIKDLIQIMEYIIEKFEKINDHMSEI